MGLNLMTALKALRQNRLQALLTLLGMSVGVAMVVVVSGLGEGAKLSIEEQIESAGPTRIVLRPGNYRPAAIDMSGEQDSGGGEPSEGSLALAPLGAAPPPDPENDAAVADARRRIREAARVKTYRTPPTAFDDGHVELLQKSIDGIRSVAPIINGNVSLDPMPGIVMRTIRIEGMGPQTPKMRDWKVEAGRMPTEKEFRDGKPVMVATADDAGRIWRDAPDPIGRTLLIKGQTVTLVGIVRSVGSEDAGLMVPLVYAPLTLSKVLLGRTNFDSIVVRTESVGVTTAVAANIKEELRKLHRLTPDEVDDFRVETQSVSAMPGMGTNPRLMRAVHSNVVNFEQTSWEEMAKSLRQANQTFTLLLAAAAAISLLVGGIGVMNIMLASVTARTREIGLRMAMGARERDVMVQFLTEAVLLAGIAGAVGLALGAIGLGIAHYGFDWAMAVSVPMLVLAVMMAALTGIVFGYGPARKAAILDPVVALRKE